MTQLVNKGFIGGHSSTKGYFQVASTNPVGTFQDTLELSNGATPLIRLRIDLDGDGIYEVVELEKIISVPSVNRVLEYVTNRPRYGSFSVTLENDDARWTDMNPDSLVYILSNTTKRYQMKRAVLELGFDWIHKADNNYWYPLSFGYINSKECSFKDKSVTFSFIDEMAYLFSTTLSNVTTNDKIFTYATGVEDKTKVVTTTYYGWHKFISAEYKNQRGQCMIPCIVNSHPSLGCPAYTRLRTLLRTDCLASDDPSRGKIYFWEWKTATQAEKDAGSVFPLEAQWVELRKADGSEWNTVFWSGTLLNVLTGTCVLRTLEGINYTRTLADYFYYFDPEDKVDVAKPDVRMSIELQSNPAVIAYRVLNMIGIDPSAIDASSTNPNDWLSEGDYDYESPYYYSFDVSKYYLDKQKAKVLVTPSETDTVLNLFEQLSQICRAGFFIDSGKEKNGQYIPTRRLHFTILQPRKTPINPKILEDSFTFTERTNTSDIINKVTISSVDTETIKKIDDVKILEISDETSKGAYGEKALNIQEDASSFISLYDASLYSQFLAQHYLYVFAEPPIRANISTNLIGMNWDIKKLMGIHCLEAFKDVTTTDLSGVFEIYGMSFDSRRFEITFDIQWAGYYLAPNGDVTSKRWAFTDQSYCDSDTNISYYCW